MREIKFRGKEIKTGRFVYGDLRQRIGFFPDIIDSFCKYEGEVGYWKFVVEPKTLGQYTGLKDKNGQEIFEGDVLRVIEYENLLMKEFSNDENRFELFTLDEVKGKQLAEYITPVIWHDGSFDLSTNSKYFDMWLAVLFGDMKRSSPIFVFEVIGNIYENPELVIDELKDEIVLTQ